MHIKLGQTVKDVATGFTGIVVNRTEYMNGNIQFSVQPPATKENAYPDAVSIDYHILDVVDEGVSARAMESTFDSPIMLGHEVEDMTSGIHGIAILKTHYLNGCAAYLVTQKQDKLGAVREDWIDQHKLKVVGKGVTKEYKKPEGKPTGGPVLRGIPRAC